MGYKSRDVSILDFLQILQEEYICTIIRHKIYPRISDKNHYKKVAKGKEEKIRDIAKRNNLSTIFDDKDLYLEFWDRVVPTFGFPTFTYAHLDDKDTKTTFPYRGTILEILDPDVDFKYAISQNVDFDNQTVEVIEKEGDSTIHKIDYRLVRRLSLEEMDRMFYYYQGNDFKVRIGEKVDVGILTSYSFEKNIGWVKLKGEDVAYPYSQAAIARIL